MLRSFTVSPEPLPIRPMARKGALTMLTTTFFTAVQIASLGSALTWLTSPESGTFTLMPLS
jgi:hypothetical protein